MSRPYIAPECKRGQSGECDGFGVEDAPCWCPCHDVAADPRAPQTGPAWKAWHDAYHANRTQPRRRTPSTWKGLLP